MTCSIKWLLRRNACHAEGFEVVYAVYFKLGFGSFMGQKPFTAKGLLRIFNATGYSFQGIKRAWKTEAAVRQEFMLALILLPLAVVIAQTVTQLVLMILSLFIVIITELLNTAIEYVVDRIGSERHDLSGAAKDIASAAVFFGLLQAATVWGLIILSNLNLVSLPLF